MSESATNQMLKHHVDVSTDVAFFWRNLLASGHDNNTWSWCFWGRYDIGWNHMNKAFFNTLGW